MGNNVTFFNEYGFHQKKHWSFILRHSRTTWLIKRWSSKQHSTKKPVTTMLTYPSKCTVLHCNHLGNTWKPLVLMTRHFDYCPSANEGDNQSVRSSAPVVSRCFPGGYNVKLYISRGRLAWWLLFFLHSAVEYDYTVSAPQYKKLIYKIDMVTKREARYVTHSYDKRIVPQ